MPTGIYWDYILKTLHTENNLVFHSLFKFEHVWHYVFAYTIDKNKWNTYFVLMGDVSGCEQFGNEQYKAFFINIGAYNAI